MSIQTFHFAVLGQPVAHSLSPIIHQAFAKQVGLSVQYDKIAAPLDGFARAAQDFIAQGGQGFNVTMPFKQEAATWVDVLKERAARAGAVNTIGINPDGTTWGDNTDGEGLILALQQDMGMSLADKAIVILGAGGAARGILPAIFAQKPKKIWLYNRSEDKIQQMILAMNAENEILALPTDHSAASAELLPSSGSSRRGEQRSPVDLIATPPLRVSAARPYGKNSELSGLGSHGVDLIINTLPAGVSYFPKHLSLISTELAYDINYHDKTQLFATWAKAQGVSVYSDGLSMLVWQAALAFKLWTGFMPDVVPVLKALRRQF